MDILRQRCAYSDDRRQRPSDLPGGPICEKRAAIHSVVLRSRRAGFGLSAFCCCIRGRLYRQTGLLWLDGKAVRYSATIEARSYAVDLIDSVDSMPGFSGSLAEVCKKVCDIYKVPFTNTAGETGEKKVRFALEQQNPFEVLDQLARNYGAILATNGYGGLELAKRKSDMLNKSAPFTLENVLDINYTHDISRCYYRYSGTVGGARLWEKDPNIRPSRVLEMEGESIGRLRARLKNEKRRRTGLSEWLIFTVHGWKAPDHKTHYGKIL